MPATATRIRWVRDAGTRHSYSSPGGRFTLFRAKNGLWVATDWHEWVSHWDAAPEKCELWCEKQLEASRGNP